MDAPIALLDSGVGGLTVLKSIKELLPNENYLYFADNGNFPYGTKPFDDLRQHLSVIIKYIATFAPKAIVIACNTASLHVEHLQKLTSIPIVDVIRPTCDCVKTVTSNNKVCLLATDATVQMAKYQQILQSSGVDVVAMPCSEFVPIVESGVCSQKDLPTISNKLKPLVKSDFDTVILGCTHFGLLKGQISAVLGNRKYVESGTPTAVKLYQILSKCNLLCTQSKGWLSILATGELGNLCKVCNQLALQFDSILSV